MKVVDPMNAALEAVAAMPTRPATAAIHDTPAVRLVVFRIEPGQEVAAHTNSGTVILTVLSGTGSILGGTEWRELGPGSVVAYAPDEPHSMKADTERFCLMATIIRAC
ncbi:MAG: cupin domain-containing protein [Gemmatimonadaceae bacterium]